MIIASLTDKGVKRPDNQDNYWCSRLDVNGEEAGILCLCDGMGGLEHGELASRLVVDKIRNYFVRSIDFSGLEEEVKKVNREIFGLPNEDNKRSGTTCTVLMCYKNTYKILHIGDSRCYRVSGDNVLLLTEDHSAIAKYKKQGIDLPEDLKRKYRNSLTRCIGVEESVSLDYIEGVYNSGDIFIVCTDGLWHYFDEYGVVCLDDLRLLIDRCIENGETDNISIGILEV